MAMYKTKTVGIEMDRLREFLGEEKAVGVERVVGQLGTAISF